MAMSDMSMSSMSMSMAATPTSSMSMTMSMSDMPMTTGMGMDSSQSSDMMSGMAMVFFTGHTTPLWSSSWTPSTVGQYAGTCIFLIFLAAVFRTLLAARSHFPRLYLRFKHRGDPQFQAQYINVEKAGVSDRPWTVDEASAVAIFDVLLAAVSYLLMLAVMTFNVGYFVSVLAGTFLGSFIFGTWAAPTGH